MSVKGLRQADWIDAAREFVANLPDDELLEATEWKVTHCFRLNRFIVAEDLLLSERMKRGLLAMSDLTPEQRRRAVKPDNLDVHAIAVGPIMDPAEIYLPAGKLSMEETRQRELSCVLSASGTDAQRATTVEQGVVHDGPVAKPDANNTSPSPLSGDGE